MATSVALLAAACSNNAATEETTEKADPVAVAQTRVSDAETGVSTAEQALTAAHQSFCGTATVYVQTLDRYGRVFTDRAATVGDVQTLGADLVEPRAEVVTAKDGVVTAKESLAAAQQELIDAEAALAAAVQSASASASASASDDPDGATVTTTVTTTQIVPEATIERVQLAEQDLARTAAGITTDTPLVQAGAAYNSAALALQIAWLNLLAEADCLSDERQAHAAVQLAAYTAALQTDLQRAGYDPGPIDGVYGPETVAAVQQLQTDSGLPTTGFVDEATARALQAKLDALGQAESTQTAALQSTLTLIGFWNGPIDGVWTDELTKALRDVQTVLGVPATGEVDAATIAAFQQKQADLIAAGTSVVTATETATATA
ncbi:MAG TPA: peptidoglycan-binding domain-containing protein, partial [Nakamurella multipartita]|nr:peptidoglycan-binding domain-containing protein [Nakamurella multipartita]